MCLLLLSRPPSKHGPQDIPETGFLRVIIVHQVNEVVTAGDVLDDLSRAAVLRVQLPPLLLPQIKCLVLGGGMDGEVMSSLSLLVYLLRSHS